jgi:hypothetical protein
MILKLSMLVSCTLLTMTAQELVQPNLVGFRYPALARAARIQGTVQFVVKSEGVQLLSGHPMLAAAARNNLEQWAVPNHTNTPLSVTYVFRLREPARQIVEVDEPIGNGFDRFFLRIFRRPVTRRGQEYRFDSKDSPPVFKNETKDGIPSIEIEIEAVIVYIQTETAQVSY